MLDQMQNFQEQMHRQMQQLLKLKMQQSQPQVWLQLPTQEYPSL
jgi:hypothetical protein